MATASTDALADRFTITGTGLELTARQCELLALAEDLGLRFSRRAARYDQDASFPFENYDELREAGLLKLCVPPSHGGLGADLFTYALVSATLGKHCSVTALTFNMHACSSLWPGLLSDALDMTTAQRAEHEALRSLHFRRIVEEGAVYAQLQQPRLPQFVVVLERKAGVLVVARRAARKAQAEVLRQRQQFALARGQLETRAGDGEAVGQCIG